MPCMTDKVTRKMLRARQQICLKSRSNYGMKVSFVADVLSHVLTCFSDIICISDMNPTKGGVCLIRAVDGTVLRTVADDPEWQKIHQQGEHQHQEAAIAQPKKHGPSRKRPRTESNNQDRVDSPLLPDLPMVPHDELRLPSRELPIRAHPQPVGCPFCPQCYFTNLPKTRIHYTKMH